MLDNQPLYVKGIEDSKKGAEGCYVAGTLKFDNLFNCAKFLLFYFFISIYPAALYIVSMVLCYGYWMYDEYKKKGNTAVSFGSASTSGRLSNKYGSISTTDN